MAKLTQSIDGRLTAAQIAIENALSDNKVQSFLSVYGYDAAKIGEGKTLFETARQLQQQQKAEYGDQYAATDAFKAKLDEAKTEYMRFLKVARVALKNDYAAFKTLELGGIRKHSLTGWIGQARTFYINALEDAGVMAKLNNFGISQEKLEAGKTMVDETEAANISQKKETGEAQQATKDRDEAIDNLDEWMSDFFAIARVALEEKPQYLEKLGIVEPS